MENKKSSLFWQLYLSILAAIGFIGVVFIGISIYIDSLNQAEDFYRDTEYAAAPILGAWRNFKRIDIDLIDSVSEDSYFEISILDSQELSNALEELEFVKQILSVNIYQDSDNNERLTSTRRIPETNSWLVISDLDVESIIESIDHPAANELKQEERDEDDFSLTIKISIVSLVFILGWVIIFQIKRIKNNIDDLVKTSESWGQGELSVRANEALPSPLDSLAKSYNNMAKDLERAMLEQQVMSNSISHELRTPLSKIQLAISLLERKYEFFSDEPLRQDLSRYVEELETLVNEILTFAKLNHQKQLSHIALINLKRLLLERMNEFKLLNQDKKIIFSADENIHTLGEAFYLQMALDNVLRNAFKYARSEINITLKLNSKYVEVVVEDDGPGISADLRESMLLPFARTDKSRNRNSGGFGLGLAIVDEIVRQHQGNLILQESELGGLYLMIQLPKGDNIQQ